MIISIMRDLNEKDAITFIFSTHDQRLLDRVKRLIRLEDGRIVDGVIHVPQSGSSVPREDSSSSHSEREGEAPRASARGGDDVSPGNGGMKR